MHKKFPSSSLIHFVLLATFFLGLDPLPAQQKPVDPGHDNLPNTSTEKATAPQETSTNHSSDENKEVPQLPGAKTILVPDEGKIPVRKNVDYEDWSKPELTAGMHTEVVPLGKTEENGMTRELFTVQWRELDPIDLWVMKPAGVKNPPVVLYLYSFPVTDERYRNMEFCRFLTQKGFAAVGFTSALTGHRFHDRPRKETFLNQLQESMGTSVHDVQMILNYLSTRGDLDMTRVGIWADGSGASIAIMASAVDARIKALDLLDPWGDWPDWLAKSSLVPEAQRADFLKLDFLASIENLEPLKLFPEVKAKQVRLQQIKEGVTVTPNVVAQKIVAAAPARTTIVRYQNRNAFLTDVASKGTGFDWIKGQLGSMILIPDGKGQDLSQVSSGNGTQSNKN